MTASEAVRPAMPGADDQGEERVPVAGSPPTDAVGESTNRPQAIRQAALQLFLRQGFAATSVREITAEVGVTVPTLYYHFGSKDGLLAELVEGLVTDGETVLADLDQRSGRLLPTRALAAYYDVVTAHLDVFRLVMADPSVRSHQMAGHRLAEQGARFLALLVKQSDDRGDLVRANAALGAIRRPLRLAGIDPVADRPQILASARAALSARP